MTTGSAVVMLIALAEPAMADSASEPEVDAVSPANEQPPPRYVPTTYCTPGAPRSYEALFAAAAETAQPSDELRPQLQADLGLAVVGLAYEQPLAEHVSLQIEAQIFGTYFLPWFSAGANVKGAGGQLRPSWFANSDGRGLYVAPFLRVDRVSDETSSGVGFCAGTVAGWAFRLTHELDLRVGGGAQYMRYKLPASTIATPFITLDLVVGYRL